MNHNTFSAKEQVPNKQDGGTAPNIPTFEEHMQDMAAENNAKVLARPSLKNEELKDGAVYMSFAVEDLSKKNQSWV